MLIEDVLQNYKDWTSLQKEAYGSYLHIPFFLRGEDTSPLLHFYEEDGYWYLSDCGTTYDHMQNRDIDIDANRERIEAVKKRFFLTEGDHHAFIMQFPSEQFTSMAMFLGYYFQAISVLANLDI